MTVKLISNHAMIHSGDADVNVHDNAVLVVLVILEQIFVETLTGLKVSVVGFMWISHRYTACIMCYRCVG